MAVNKKKYGTEIKIGISIIAVTILGFLLIAAPSKTTLSNKEDVYKNSYTDKNINTKSLSNSKKIGQQQDSSLNDRISQGEEILVKVKDNSDKQLGVEAISKGNFATALTVLDRSLELEPNDPEALIYYNNSVASVDSRPVEIAVSVPIGSNLGVAQEILRGVAQAQDEINARGKGGIRYKGNNHFVKIVIANDDNNPEVAAKISTEFVSNPEMLAVVGHNSSSASLAAAPIYEAGNLVMMSPTSVANELSRVGSHIFRTTPSTDLLAQTIAEHIVNSDFDQIALCFDSASPASSSFSSSFSTAVFQLEGKTINVDCDFSSSSFDPESIISKTISNGADSLLLIPSVDKISQALEVAKANDSKLPIFANQSVYTHQTLKMGSSDVNGMVLPVSWHPELNSNSDFSTKSKELWGTPVTSWRTASSYDATRSLVEGLIQAGGKEGLDDALVNSNFSISGVLGEIKFQHSGDRLIKGTLVEVRPDPNSEEFVFKPVAQIEKVKGE